MIVMKENSRLHLKGVGLQENYGVIVENKL